MRARARRCAGRAACLTLTLGLLAGCTCGHEPPGEPRTRRDEHASRGGDEGLFPPVGDPSLAPPRERFEPIALEEGREMARGRSWVGAAALGGGDVGGRDEVGNWLCRLQALWGPPPGLTDDGFRYVFRDTETDRVIVAYVDSHGPSMGAVMTAPEGWRLGDEDRTAAGIDAFVALVEATRPIDCRLEIAGRVVGMESDRPLR